MKLFRELIQLKPLHQKNSGANGFRNIPAISGILRSKRETLQRSFSGIDLMSKIGGLALVFISYSMIVKGNITAEPFLLFFFYIALLQSSVSALVSAVNGIYPQLTSIRNLSSFFPNLQSRQILIIYLPVLINLFLLN